MIVDRKTGISRFGWMIFVIATTLSILVHVNGETIGVGGVAISNAFLLLFVLPHLARVGFLRQFPREYLLPLALLVTIAGFDFIGGGSGRAILAFQGVIFLFFPYFVSRRGLSEIFVKTMFYFVVASQVWLLVTNDFTLPADDLGGFFVSRRTVHSLALGAVALLFLSNIKHQRVRVALVAGIAALLLISNARGAAILFIITSIVFGGDLYSTRSRIYALATVAFSGALALWWQRELLEHFALLLATSGGSSTGYRLYLLQVLVDEVGRYWFSGLPDMEIQYLLADQFTMGKLYQSFALDNSFTNTALRFGLLPLALLVTIAIRLGLLRQSYPAYFVGWLFLDDILGSALGWLLLGQAILAFRTNGKSRMETGRSNSIASTSHRGYRV